MKSFIVKASDLFDEKKNPGLKLSVDSIIKNKKVQKVPFEKFMEEKEKEIIKE